MKIVVNWGERGECLRFFRNSCEAHPEPSIMTAKHMKGVYLVWIEVSAA